MDCKITPLALIREFENSTEWNWVSSQTLGKLSLKPVETVDTPTTPQQPPPLVTAASTTVLLELDPTRYALKLLMIGGTYEHEIFTISGGNFMRNDLPSWLSEISTNLYASLWFWTKDAAKRRWLHGPLQCWFHMKLQPKEVVFHDLLCLFLPSPRPPANVRGIHALRKE